MRILMLCRRMLSVLAVSLFLALIVAPPPRVHADLPHAVFFANVPLHFQTHTATDVAYGRHWGSAADAGLIASTHPGVFQSLNPWSLHGLAGQGLRELGVSLPGLDSLFGGSQFYGQAALPQSYYPGFQDPLAPGGVYADAFSNAVSILNMGFGSASPYNFGTSFLQGADPVFGGGFGLGGGGSFGGPPAAGPAAPAAADSHASASPPLSPVEERYLALAQHQMDVMYREPALSTLRAESNAAQLLLLYSDPLYSFWSYELDALLQQIVTTRPSYRRAAALAQTIASYTTPPNDNATLEARYSQRLELAALNAQVDAETRAWLAANPTVGRQLAEIAAQQASRVQQLVASPTARAYDSDWSRRYQEAFVNSSGFRSLSRELEQIFTDFPAFQEYLQLNREVVELLPSLANHPRVVAVSQMVAEVNASPTVARAFAEAYEEFTDDVDEELDDTTYKAEVERAYERLNGLIEADPNYKLLRETQFLAVLRSQELQKRIHDAVANCAATLDQYCDPYRNPQVLALLPAYNQGNFNLLLTVGQFYEVYNQFMYEFSRSPAYLDLQRESQERVEASLAPVRSELAAAQQEFMDEVNEIPQVSAAQKAIAELGGILRRDSRELDTRLTRMAALARTLTGQ